MSQDQQQVSNQISIEDLELSLEVYEIQSDQKLAKLQQLFKEKGTLDLRQIFYQERSSLEVKFQNIIGDLTQFLINQQVPSTQKLRKTFYRILQSPLLLLFKVSRFEIFNLRLNAFDIQLEPIDAISELAKQLYKNIDQYISTQKNPKSDYQNSIYQSYSQFAQHAKINLIQDQIFILYSYLRKGSNILKKKIEDKIKIVQIFNTIEEKLILTILKNQDVKTLKQLSTLNYEIYLLQNSFDVICFFLKIPFRSIYRDIFKQLQTLANKSKLTCNYDIFLNIFIKYNKQIFNKINIQKIDSVYEQYIENISLSLLELWGCRICLYKQFFMFFKILFEIHTNKKKLLQKCLSHVPNLSKQDISLTRANYRQNVENKNVQLISLLKKVSLDQMNSELNGIYHQILFNLNFQSYTKQEIISLLTLVNQNSNIDGFVSTVEKAFKQWNHTIDFNNSVKYIQSQFNLPKNISQAQVLQSLRLFTNLCILQSKGFGKQFQVLVTKGTITKAVGGLCRFLLSFTQKPKIFVQNSISQTFILHGFNFLQNTLSKNAQQWEQLLLLFASNIPYFSTQQNKQKIKNQISSYIQQNIQNYRMGKSIQILKKTFQFDKNQQNINLIVDMFMFQSVQKNKENKLNRFFDKNVKELENQLLSKQESEFLKKYACIKNDIITVKQPSCFKISELQVITNPIQFEKAMDNYYFTLDSNSKRFIQYIVQEWPTQLTSQYNFYSDLILNLIKKYPISIPILSNIRIKPNQNSKQTFQYRFVQYLVNQLLGSQACQVKCILSQIIKIDTIKYRNGKDYIVQEIAPMITKRCLTLINSGNLNNSNKANSTNNKPLSVQIYQILSLSLQKFKLTDLKLDTIQKSLVKINYQIQNSNNQKIMSKLSQCSFEIIKIFFRKKQIDIKKKGLESIYQQILWNQIRTYNPASGQNNPAKKVQIQSPVINEQIMVSPHTLTQQFNNEEYKVKKIENKGKKTAQQQRNIKFSQVLSSISLVDTSKQWSSVQNQTSKTVTRQIDLSKMTYDLQFYLGTQNINLLQAKQNWKIKQKYSSTNAQSAESNQKSINFVQYYLREMSFPQIDNEIALKSILSYMKKQIGVSLIWTNPKNLQKLFTPAILLLDYAGSNGAKNLANISQNLKSQSQTWKDIVDFVNTNKIESFKRLLSLLSKLGYHNIWGQNYKSANLHPNIIKALEIKQIQQQSFLSILLKRCLQFQPINQVKTQIDILFDRIFTTRPQEQTSLMYKVGIDKTLLNLIMKSLQIKNLNNISFLFHSNFNNLRLYTDQLHEGLKALNMASKTRSYNQYIQLSKQIEDEQFMGPMKLFKQNFMFFIKIQKQGYNYKKIQQKKLCLERLINILRKYDERQKLQTVCKQCDKIIQQYQQEIQKLQISIANRIKSFYLVTKLRDLSYQNSITINLVNQILKEKNLKQQKILAEIGKVEIFTLLMLLNTELVRFDNKWNNQTYFNKYNTIDRSHIEKQTNFCTTRRFSHSMNKTYQKCDLELDQVIQRCLDQLKVFFSTPEGQLFLTQNSSIIYPPFVVKSFIIQNEKNRLEHLSNIKSSLAKNGQKLDPTVINVNSKQLVTDCVTQLRNVNSKLFYGKDLIKVNLQNKTISLDSLLQIVIKNLISNQTLVLTKTKESGFLTFNKHKTSQATLEEIQVLGYLVAYCIYHQIPLWKGPEQLLPLHSSIIAALSFGIIDFQDLLQIDFKIWQDVKRILSIQDSKTLNLNFSYIFQNVKTLQNQRIQLVDKGASKKVNNLNRQEFCDAIACQVLYKNYSQQISRFMRAILTVIPKQYLSTMKISQIYSIFYTKSSLDVTIKKYMKKIGLVTPQLVIRQGKKIQNLKDYQNIQWASQIILQNPNIRQKIWKNESNLMVLTTIGSKPSLKYKNQTLIIQHFDTKQSMKNAFNQI